MFSINVLCHKYLSRANMSKKQKILNKLKFFFNKEQRNFQANQKSEKDTIFNIESALFCDQN